MASFGLTKPIQKTNELRPDIELDQKFIPVHFNPTEDTS
jgi:hypothetical protein